MSEWQMSDYFFPNKSCLQTMAFWVIRSLQMVSTPRYPRSPFTSTMRSMELKMSKLVEELLMPYWLIWTKTVSTIKDRLWTILVRTSRNILSYRKNNKQNMSPENPYIYIHTHINTQYIYIYIYSQRKIKSSMEQLIFLKNSRFLACSPRKKEFLWS